MVCYNYGSVGVLITIIIMWLAPNSATYHTTFLHCTSYPIMHIDISLFQVYIARSDVLCMHSGTAG